MNVQSAYTMSLIYRFKGGMDKTDYVSSANAIPDTSEAAYVKVRATDDEFINAVERFLMSTL